MKNINLYSLTFFYTFWKMAKTLKYISQNLILSRQVCVYVENMKGVLESNLDLYIIELS